MLNRFQLPRAILFLLVTGTLLAPVVARAEGDPFQGDTRLDRRVAVSAPGTSVSEVLAALSEKTGVRLTAARPVADDKVVIFSPARPLREVLSDLAALLNNRWQTKETAGRPATYSLERSPGAAPLEQKLLRERQERILAALDEQVRALAETPEQLAKRSAGDPARKALSGSSGRLATYLYGFASRQQRQQVVAEGRLSLPFAVLRADHQRLIREEFGRVIAEQNRYLEALKARLAAEGTGDNSDFSKLDASIARPEDVEKYGLAFRLENDSGAAVLSLTLGQGSHLRMAELEGRPQWVLPVSGDPYSRKPVVGTAQVPALEHLQEAAKEKRWLERLQKLAERSGQPLLADFYRGVPLARPGAAITEPPADRRAALDRLAESEGYLWWSRGKTLLLRKRDWYAQQLYEVPDRWLQRIIDRLAAQPTTLTVGDVLTLKELTLAQVIGLNALPDRRYYELKPDGRGCNLKDLPAALNLLEWAHAPAARPVLGWRGLLRVTPEVLQQKQVPLPPLSSVQAGFITRFLSGKSGIDPTAPPGKIGLELSCNLDLAVAGDPRLPLGYANLDLSWTYPGRHAEQVHVLLPLEWPERQKPGPVTVE